MRVFDSDREALAQMAQAGVKPAESVRAGYGKEYFPALAKVIAGKASARKKGG